MKIALYFDEDSQESSLIRALRSRGVDVISATEVGMNGRLDDEQLRWASSHDVFCIVARRKTCSLISLSVDADI